jgi:oxaloacetate decarboxylase beta subunit
LELLTRFLESTGIAQLVADPVFMVKTLAMYVIIGTLLYLAVVKGFEPLLLIPIAFGMLLANLPGANLIHLEYFFDDFYFTQVAGEEITAPLAQQIKAFLETLEANGFHDVFVKTAIDGTSEVIWTFDFTGLDSDAIAKIGHIFNESFNGVAYFSGDVYHVNMTTMISEVINHGGLVDILYLGVKLGIYPSLIFLGVGAMTDFSPLIANPKSLLMGAGAQIGVFVAFFAALLMGFTPLEASSIGIIGGADGPTAILVTKTLAPHLLGAIAIAAYSYMALIPIIQPPFMRLLTTEKERKIKMSNLRPVSKAEQILFPIIVTVVVCLIIPDAAALVGFLMLGNLFNVSGVTERLSKTAQNELCNIVTICLGVSVGATANAENFLKLETIGIIILGLAAFVVSTCGGLLTGKIMCWLTKGKINPLIGSAGVSAVPMAARVAQDEGRKADPSNFLLMHAMGPNVAGVIGSAVAAGVFLSFFG